MEHQGFRRVSVVFGLMVSTAILVGLLTFSRAQAQDLHFGWSCRSANCRVMQACFCASSSSHGRHTQELENLAGVLDLIS